MKEHYTWPDLGEEVEYNGEYGIVTSRWAGMMSLGIKLKDGRNIIVKLEDYIVYRIRNPL